MYDGGRSREILGRIIYPQRLTVIVLALSESLRKSDAPPPHPHYHGLKHVETPDLHRIGNTQDVVTVVAMIRSQLLIKSTRDCTHLLS